MDCSAATTWPDAVAFASLFAAAAAVLITLIIKGWRP